MARILVIDDDIEIIGMLKKTLVRSGYEVMVAADGDEALKLQKMTAADLIITDLIMPRKEGLETIMEFRRDYPSVKIIAMSGGGKLEPETYLKTANFLGAQATLAKPFELEEMLREVKKLLG
jgi:DNA-binding response OmpR family regulator